jgi:hypothetical protein
MQPNKWAVALGLILGAAMPARAEIIRGSMPIRGAEMP